MTCGYIHTSSFTGTFQFTETLLLRWFQMTLFGFIKLHIHIFSYAGTFKLTETLLLRWFHNWGINHPVVNKGDSLNKNHFISHLI